MRFISSTSEHRNCVKLKCWRNRNMSVCCHLLFTHSITSCQRRSCLLHSHFQNIKTGTCSNTYLLNIFILSLLIHHQKSNCLFKTIKTSLFFLSHISSLTEPHHLSYVMHIYKVYTVNQTCCKVPLEISHDVFLDFDYVSHSVSVEHESNLSIWSINMIRKVLQSM